MAKAQQQGVLHPVPWYDEEMTYQERAFVGYDEYIPSAVGGLFGVSHPGLEPPSCWSPGRSRRLHPMRVSRNEFRKSYRSSTLRSLSLLRLRRESRGSKE